MSPLPAPYILQNVPHFILTTNLDGLKCVYMCLLIMSVSREGRLKEPSTMYMYVYSKINSQNCTPNVNCGTNYLKLRGMRYLIICRDFQREVLEKIFIVYSSSAILSYTCCYLIPLSLLKDLLFKLLLTH